MTAPPAAPEAPEAFPLGGRRPEFTFLRDNIPPPAPLYIGPADVLGISVMNLSQAAQNVLIAGRMLLPDGQVQIFAEPLKVAAQGFAQKAVEPGEVVLLNLTGVVLGLSVTGAVYVSITLQRGNTVGLNTSALLLAGTLSDSTPISWPSSPARTPADGEGFIQSIQVANPAAGSEVVFAVPTLQRMLLLAFCANLQTSVAVANRRPRMELRDNSGNSLYLSASTNTQTAGSGARYSSGNGLSGLADIGGNEVQLAWPNNLRMQPGFVVRTLTRGIDVADQWSAISLLVATWFEG